MVPAKVAFDIYYGGMTIDFGKITNMPFECLVYPEDENADPYNSPPGTLTWEIDGNTVESSGEWVQVQLFAY